MTLLCAGFLWPSPSSLHSVLVSVNRNAHSPLSRFTSLLRCKCFIDPSILLCEPLWIPLSPFGNAQMHASTHKHLGRGTWFWGLNVSQPDASSLGHRLCFHCSAFDNISPQLSYIKGDASFSPALSSAAFLLSVYYHSVVSFDLSVSALIEPRLISLKPGYRRDSMLLVYSTVKSYHSFITQQNISFPWMLNIILKQQTNNRVGWTLCILKIQPYDNKLAEILSLETANNSWTNQILECGIQTVDWPCWLPQYGE